MSILASPWPGANTASLFSSFSSLHVQWGPMAVTHSLKCYAYIPKQIAWISLISEDWLKDLALKPHLGNKRNLLTVGG